MSDLDNVTKIKRRIIKQDFNYGQDLVEVSVPITDAISLKRTLIREEVLAGMKDFEYFICKEGTSGQRENYDTICMRLDGELWIINDCIRKANICSFHEDVINNPKKEDIDYVFERINSMITYSQYDYCDMMLESFFMKVFGKTPSEMFCGGIVSAHGDKCYGYRSEWAKLGIEPRRGTLVFLLSYVSKYAGKIDRSAMDEWVVTHYKLLEPIILECEAELGIKMKEVKKGNEDA